MNKKIIWGLIIIGIAGLGYYGWKKGWFGKKELTAGEQQAANEMAEREASGLGVPQTGRPNPSGASTMTKTMRTAGGGIVNADLAKSVKGTQQRANPQSAL